MSLTWDNRVDNVDLGTLVVPGSWDHVDWWSWTTHFWYQCNIEVRNYDIYKSRCAEHS